MTADIEIVPHQATIVGLKMKRAAFHALLSRPCGG
jgi:hypothetical protein